MASVNYTPIIYTHTFITIFHIRRGCFNRKSEWENERERERENGFKFNDIEFVHSYMLYIIHKYQAHTKTIVLLNIFNNRSWVWQQLTVYVHTFQAISISIGRVNLSWWHLNIFCNVSFISYYVFLSMHCEDTHLL